MQQRRAAEVSEEPELTLEDINAEIHAAREERRKKYSDGTIKKVMMK